MRRLLHRLAAAGDRMTASGLRLLGRQGGAGGLAGGGERRSGVHVATGTIQATSMIAHEEPHPGGRGVRGRARRPARRQRSPGHRRRQRRRRRDQCRRRGLRDTGHQISQRDGGCRARAPADRLGVVPGRLHDRGAHRPGAHRRRPRGRDGPRHGGGRDDRRRRRLRRAGAAGRRRDRPRGHRATSTPPTWRCSASTRARTDDISLAFATSAAEQVAAQSDYGDIDIVLPDTPADADVRYAIDARAGAGHGHGQRPRGSRRRSDDHRDTGDGDVDIAYAATCRRGGPPTPPRRRTPGGARWGCPYPGDTGPLHSTGGRPSVPSEP